jgi:anti-sigma28 factor (negative regulator of flagellin synthesis)
MFSRVGRRKKRELYRELATSADWNDRRAKALSNAGNLHRSVVLQSLKDEEMEDPSAKEAKECALAYNRSANMQSVENSVKSILTFEMKQPTFECVWNEFKEYKKEEEERDPESSVVMDDDFYRRTKKVLEKKTEQTRYLRSERRNVAKRLTRYAAQLAGSKDSSSSVPDPEGNRRKRRRRGLSEEEEEEEEEDEDGDRRGRNKRRRTDKVTIQDVLSEKKKREEEKSRKREERINRLKGEGERGEGGRSKGKREKQKFTGKESFFDFFKYAQDLIDGALRESDQPEIKTIILTLKGEMVVMDLENGVIDTNKLTGDERMDAIMISLDLFVWSREETQMEMHDEMLRVLLPIIYGDEWDDNYERILSGQGLLKHMAELFIICARRWGKTVGCAMMVAILMIFVPSITIAIFSTGQRASGKFMIQVQKFMFQLPFMDACKIVRCNDETMIISLFGNERRMDAYPCTVGVCLSFHCLVKCPLLFRRSVDKRERERDLMKCHFQK